ncbi:hypothetical protein BaRGS_00006876 [Batillaria attramentaria]|uniref:Schlafen AlbA-2 domain-containing protein n=1 Tax=Batillaria attramentaria TaxID=370345 RepID=A0ABD0LQK9_9CAEN
MPRDQKKRRVSKSDSHEETGCEKCRRFEATNSVVVAQDLITDVVTKQRNAKKALGQFFETINAALNKTEDETVCIHTKNPHLLGEFDKKVDDKLAKLLSDDSFYEENFDRYIYDPNHVVFKVKERKRPISILDYATKVSLNKGLTDPTYTQMTRFVKLIHSERQGKTSPTQTAEFVFARNDEVKVKAEPGVPFQESVRVQAKPAKDKLRGLPGSDTNDNRIDKQLDLWWKEQDLPEFISAFTKLHDGGSVFLGVLEIFDERIQTRKFMSHGIVLNGDERRELKTKLQQKINEMKWFSPLSEDPNGVINVTYHEVRNGEENECVVEVSVKYFHGLSFVGGGPKAFERQGNNKPTEIPFNTLSKELLDASV